MGRPVAHFALMALIARQRNLPAPPGRTPDASMSITPPAVELPPIAFAAPTPGRWDRVTSLRLKVLVVDDVRDTADTLAGLLVTVGADVRVCYDGPSALAASRSFSRTPGCSTSTCRGWTGARWLAASEPQPDPAPCSWLPSPE